MADETPAECRRKSRKPPRPTTPSPKIRAAAPEGAAAPNGCLNQDEIDSLLGFDVNSDQLQDKSGVRAIINSALVSYERLPMLEIVFDRLVRLMTTSPAQFHLRQCRSQPGFHHLDPLRRLSQLHSAARHSGGVPCRRAGQLRPVHRGFQPDLFHRGRASGRPPRLFGHAHRGPALYHHRTHPGPAHDRSDHAGHVRRFRTAGAGAFQPGPAGDQSAFCRHRAPGQCRHPGQAAHRHGRPRRAHRTAAALCHAGADPQAACCSSSWARNSAATPSGKAIWPPNCGPPRSISRPFWTSRPCR